MRFTGYCVKSSRQPRGNPERATARADPRPPPPRGGDPERGGEGDPEELNGPVCPASSPGDLPKVESRKSRELFKVESRLVVRVDIGFHSRS